MTRSLRWASLAMSTLLIVGCGVPGSDDATTTTTTGSNLGGDRLPVKTSAEEYGHNPRPLTGSLQFGSNGCWAIDLGDGPRVVIFPEGFTQSEDGRAMVAPDATAFVDRMDVDAVGGIVSSQTLPGGPDGYWGNYLAFCDPVREEVVVADGIEPAFDPTALREEELLGLLQNERLDRSLGCGFGFTIMSESERVGIQFYPTEMQPLPGPITFPDNLWVGEVLIGKNLAVNHCDDVVEGWEPEMVIAARWPIAAGTLAFDLPDETDCGTAGPVTATFKDGTIDTDSGARAIPDLSMINEAFGCFAG